MYKTLLLILLASISPLLTADINAQCPTNIIVSSQAVLESFIAQYPECENLTGRLKIQGSVNDLSPLSNIKSAGSVEIKSDLLTSLNGLQNLVSIEDDLIIWNNANLVSISELTSLQTIGGQFKFENNPKTVELIGPESLMSIGGLMQFRLNASLTTVTGFSSLQEVGMIGFSEHTNPLVIEGTRNISIVGSNITIASSVQTINFEKLQAVGGSIIFSCQAVTGLDNLESIMGQLRFHTNQEIIPQFLMLTSIGGQLQLDNQSVLTYDGFNALQMIGGDLIIKELGKLEQITGFNSLMAIEGSFNIGANDQLTTISGFQKLASIKGYFFDIWGNSRLTSIEGFQYVTEVTGSFRIIENESLSNCMAMCPLLDMGSIGGQISIYSNGANCISKETIVATCNSILKDIKLIDANLRLGSSPPDGNNIASLGPEDLILMDLERVAVTADGVSKVLLKFNFKAAGQFSISWDDGLMETPWGTNTYSDGNSHYGFALFTTPEEFGDDVGSSTRLDGIDMREIQYTVSISVEGEQQSFVETIPIVRPPVVLMHGTFSSPDKAWKTPSEGGEALFDILTNEGFKVFAVDYESTNGSGDPSSFETNALAVWKNKDGIKDALTYYRETANIAVTQADVIGHSMGGVLPRVYVSQHYNPDGYKRAENFMEGDINRFISVAGNHFGSHLGELQIFLVNKNSPFNVGALDWIVQGAVNYISAWMSGTSPSGAVQDQRPAPGTKAFPAGDALAVVGATQIPVHAITLSVPAGGLKNMIHDPNEENYDLYWYLSLLMYYNADMRNLYLDHKLWLIEQGLRANTTLDGGDPQELFPGYNDLQLFKTMIEVGILNSGMLISALDGKFETPADIEILKPLFAETEMSNFSDPFLDIFKAGENPIGVPAKYYQDNPPMPTSLELTESLLSEQEQSMEGLRALIFNNDDNDGVIRVESQRGDLEISCPECVTHFDNVLHGFAPRYPEVQQKILSLLNSGMKDFNANGFPAADHAQKLYYPEKDLLEHKVPLEGDLAICRSGMVPSHAKAFARVADKENVIILARPVNPDATALILAGASTKEMNVKPKSSNWGPQKGYLPVNQRYSKLWKIFEGEERTKKIDAYNEKSAENITEGITLARHLEIQKCDQPYLVFIDRSMIMPSDDQSAEDEVVLVPVADMTKVCQWISPYDQQRPIKFEDCVQLSAQHQLIPFEVMATPRAVEDDGTTNRFLTADYDLLMIGFYKGPKNNPYNPPMNLPFKEGVGQMTTEQEDLLDKINAEVIRTGYDGGNVSHHGPENQFGKSPYIDYPLTVFVPDDIPDGILINTTVGRVLSIDMGPPGFRDIYLKQFVNEMRLKGYDLYDNPEARGWDWTWNEGAKGFLLEDSKDLPDYVEQLTGFKCEIKGEAKTICPKEPVKESSDSFEDWLFDRSPSVSGLIGVSPNPVIGNSLYIKINSENEEQVELFLLDGIGNHRVTIKRYLRKGIQSFDIDVSNLEPGLYTIAGNNFTAVRFVRM